MKKSSDRVRCSWARNELAIRYHDEEWGKPVHDDRLLFEFLILEGAQAGLSWDTILQKRDNYRKAFDRFDPMKVRRYDAAKIAKLMGDAGIVRNRLKIASAVSNAKAFLQVQEEFGTFDKYVWQFVAGKPKVNRFRLGNSLPGLMIRSGSVAFCTSSAVTPGAISSSTSPALVT
jgi:DNA-3-methyladenine glycosylase I